MIQAVISAGGRGERLAPLTHDLPKALVKVGGKPIIDRQIDEFAGAGVERILILTGHLHDKVQAHLGDGSNYGVEITYSREVEPLGTGGSLKMAENLLESEFFFAYCDLLFDVDLPLLLENHRSNDALVTMCVHPSSHPEDSDLLEVGKDWRVLRVAGKPKPGSQFQNISNAGLYVMEKKLLSFIPEGKAALDNQVIPLAISAGERVFAYNTQELIMDIGTHERLKKAEEMLKASEA